MPTTIIALDFSCPCIGWYSQQPRGCDRAFNGGACSAGPLSGRRKRVRCFGKGDGDGGDRPDNGAEQGKGEKQDVDWDKAWSSYRLKKKKSFFSIFDMEKYVSRSPQNQNYPLSEEIDPLKRTEKATLNAWTDPKFTLAGFGVIVGLFIYMVVIVGAPPPK